MLESWSPSPWMLDLSWWQRNSWGLHNYKTDLKYNIRTSMGYLRRLHNRYKSWPIVFGYYNTGYPRVNDYALRVVNHKLNW